MIFIKFICRLIVVTFRKLSAKLSSAPSYFCVTVFLHCCSLIMGMCSLYADEAKKTFNGLKECCCMMEKSNNTKAESCSSGYNCLRMIWNGLVICFILSIMFLGIILGLLLIVWTCNIFGNHNYDGENPQGPLLQEGSARGTRSSYSRGTHYKNLNFYTNKIKSKPDGDFIDDIHKNWHGQYKRLERHHGYIQWLFPIFEEGLNSDADPLTAEEVEIMKKETQVQSRLILSFELMLDFYGLQLITGREPVEIEHAGNWQERYKNLNQFTHNCLRITRIIKCLCIFGLEDYATAMVKILATDILVNSRLPNCRRSAEEYWILALPKVEQVKVASHVEHMRELKLNGGDIQNTRPMAAEDERSTQGQHSSHKHHDSAARDEEVKIQMSTGDCEVTDSERVNPVLPSLAEVKKQESTLSHSALMGKCEGNAASTTNDDQEVSILIDVNAPPIPGMNINQFDPHEVQIVCEPTVPESEKNIAQSDLRPEPADVIGTEFTGHPKIP